MSRIGIRPISIPENITVNLSDNVVKVEGAGNILEVKIPYGIKVAQKDNALMVDRATNEKQQKALHGTIRSLLANAIAGISTGFAKKLELVGIGYRASVEDNKLTLLVGFTHPVVMAVPEGLSAKVEKNVITLNGTDKQKVGQFAAEVRAVRQPEPYKGKGIRYENETVRRKQGKAVKAAA